MTLTDTDRDALETLDIRIKVILPEEYRETYESVQPVSMGSASLKYDADGKVAWNDIWSTFCDLAMAGGPPHKGTLLHAGTPADVAARTQDYARVTAEMCRGITMATNLPAFPSPIPGWVRVTCRSRTMAGWLMRAIVMENVAARADDTTIDLPAAPHYRVEKEIKNVVTVIAKTCHYWAGHMSGEQRRAIAILFARMAKDSPLIEPGDLLDEELAVRMAFTIQQQAGLVRSSHRYVGWLGLDCPAVARAIWMMRALVVSNVLSRREGTTLFVPVNAATDPGGEVVTRGVELIGRVCAR